MTSPVIVAIDGPSGAGKSTAARLLAQRLKVPYIDTGAMYRAAGLAVREAGIALPIADPASVERIAGSLHVSLEPQAGGSRVLLDGRDVTEAIREPEISRYASAVSALSAVRRRMVAEQRRLARQRGGVIEGRDIGTVVFPETPHKFFLTASSRVRAERRVRELEERGHPQSFERVLAEMEARDSSDQTRADSPLKSDDTCVVIDSSDQDVDAVVAEMERRVRAAG